MTNVVVVLAVVLVVGYVMSTVRRHRRGLVAERGTSVGADLGALADTPRVRVRAVTEVAQDRVRLALMPEPVPGGGSELTASSDLDLLVLLRAGDFGLGLLREWRDSASSIAIVMPPDSRIVRLRSVESLQHLTLRRVDDE